MGAPYSSCDLGMLPHHYTLWQLKSGEALSPSVQGIHVPLIPEDLPCSPELHAILRGSRAGLGSWASGSPRGCRCSGRRCFTPRLLSAGGRGLRALRPHEARLLDWGVDG